MKIIDAKGEYVELLSFVIFLKVSCPNFIFSNFKFQVEIKLHASCSQ